MYIWSLNIFDVCLNDWFWRINIHVNIWCKFAYIQLQNIQLNFHSLIVFIYIHSQPINVTKFLIDEPTFWNIYIMLDLWNWLYLYFWYKWIYLMCIFDHQIFLMYVWFVFIICLITITTAKKSYKITCRFITLSSPVLRKTLEQLHEN